MQPLLIFLENFLQTSFSFGILFRISRTIFNNLHLSKITFHYFLFFCFFIFLCFEFGPVFGFCWDLGCKYNPILNLSIHNYNWFSFIIEFIITYIKSKNIPEETKHFFKWLSFLFSKSSYRNHFLCLKKDESLKSSARCSQSDQKLRK